MADTFDEEWTESMELLQYWPEGQELEKWTKEEEDNFFEADSFVDKFVNFGNNQKRDGSNALTPASDEEIKQYMKEAGLLSVRGTPASDEEIEQYMKETGLISRRLPSQEADNTNHDNVPAKFARGPAADSTDLIVRGQYEPRFWFLIPIFLAVARTVVAVLRVTRFAIKIAKGTNKISRATKAKKSAKVAKDKNWRTCLSGKGPSK